MISTIWIWRVGRLANDHQTVAIEDGELIAGIPPPELDSTTLILGYPLKECPLAIMM